MKLFETMERTLQVDMANRTPGLAAVIPVWPVTFQRPIDAALHLNTPPMPQPTSVPNNGPRFLE